MSDSIRLRTAGSEREKQLRDDVPIVAGVDPNNPSKVYMLPIGPDGVKVEATLVESGGEHLPDHDSVTLEYYGSTNNVQYVRYRTGGTGGTVVATRTITYVGGGAANNDIIIGSQLTIP